MNYSDMASKLQSRLSIRRNLINLESMWKAGYKQLGRRKELKVAKKTLRELNSSQHLDKKLLKLVHSVQREDKFFENSIFFGEFA